MNTREIILLLLLVALFLLLRKVLQLRRKKWFIQWLSSILPSQKALEAPKIRQMKPKSEKDYPPCPKEPAKETEPQICPHSLIPWSAMKKGKGGRPKQSITQGHACLKPECYYYGITDQTIHALIANGSHGKREKIGGLTYQACQAGFSRRRNTPLYRLKTPSQVVEKSHAAGSTWSGDFSHRRCLSSSGEYHHYHHQTYKHGSVVPHNIAGG